MVTIDLLRSGEPQTLNGPYLWAGDDDNTYRPFHEALAAAGAPRGEVLRVLWFRSVAYVILRDDGRVRWLTGWE